MKAKGGKSEAVSKKAGSKVAVKAKPMKSTKAGKDPNKPKRPASAFFVFMEDFRKQYKEEFPNNKSVAAVGKAGGGKWKSMTEKEKAPYVVKASKRKQEYEQKMESYNKKLTGGDDDEEESDKSKSEVNDEDDEEGSGSGEEDEDDE